MSNPPLRKRYKPTLIVSLCAAIVIATGGLLYYWKTQDEAFSTSTVHRHFIIGKVRLTIPNNYLATDSLGRNLTEIERAQVRRADLIIVEALLPELIPRSKENIQVFASPQLPDSPVARIFLHAENLKERQRWMELYERSKKIENDLTRSNRILGFQSAGDFPQEQYLSIEPEGFLIHCTGLSMPSPDCRVKLSIDSEFRVEVLMRYVYLSRVREVAEQVRRLINGFVEGTDNER